MAAPQIPNLLSRPRKGPATQRSSRPGNNQISASAKPSNDTIIQATDTDAALSRLSAASLSYFEDPFAAAFSPVSHATSPPSHVRRMPIINRGTYVRTTAIDELVDEFFKRYEGAVQVVSLGAGSDTRFFRLVQRDGWEDMAKRIRWHEIDFATATKGKVEVLERNPSIMEVLSRAAIVAQKTGAIEGDGSVSEHGSGDRTPAQTQDNLEDGSASKVSTDSPDQDPVIISSDQTTIHCQPYHLHAIDLRDLASSNPPSLVGLDTSIPTLLLSECCLTYLPTDITTALLTHFLRTLVPVPTPLHMVLYEPLQPDDAFGRTMISNLASRGISMPGLEACPTIDAHVDRLRGVGFEAAQGQTVGKWWSTKVSWEEKQRLRAMEGLDEEEEWVLLAAHYGFIWSWRHGDGGGGKVVDLVEAVK